MKRKVAVPALLFAVLFALVPFWAFGQAADCAFETVYCAGEASLSFQHQAEQRDEQAVMPPPTVVPIPAHYAVKPFLVLVIVIMLLLGQSRVICIRHDTGAVAASVFLCLLDHPHHAPPVGGAVYFA